MDKNTYELQSEIRLYEEVITSNRESLCHGEYNLGLVLITRRMLKGMGAVWLLACYKNRNKDRL